MDLSLHQYLKDAEAMHSEFGVVPLTISIIQHGFQNPLLWEYLREWYLPVSIIRYDGGNNDKLDWFIGTQFFHDLEQYVLTEIQRNPGLVDTVIEQSRAHGAEIERLTRTIEGQVGHGALTHTEMAARLGELIGHMEKLCAYGFIPVMTDLYYFEFSKLLERVVAKHVTTTNGEKSAKEIVSILSSPAKAGGTKRHSMSWPKSAKRMVVV